MSLQSHFEFLFVGKDEGSFLENYSYDLTEEHGARGGKLFVALEIQNNPTDAEIIGETLADNIRRVFFSDLEQDPYTRLEEALKAANSVIDRFKEQRVSRFIGTMHVVVGAICGNELYLTQTGDAEAYLVRKNFVSVITEGLNDGKGETEDLFVNIASGTLEKGDFVVFSTTRLLRYISQIEFVKCFSDRNLIGSLEVLKDRLTPEILSRIGIVGIVLSGEMEPIDRTSKSVEVHEELSQSGVDLSGKDALRGLFSRFFSQASGLLSGVTKREYKSKKDRLLIALIIVILILTAGIWFTKRQNQAADEIVKMDQALQDSLALISEAETKGQFNKKIAQELLLQAEGKTIEVRNSGTYRNKANEVLEKIQETRKLLDNVNMVTEPKIVADLTTKRSNVSALGLIGTDDVIYVYEYNAFYEIIGGQLKDPKTIDDNETVIAGTEFSDRNSSVFMTKSGKLIEYVDGHFQFADTQDESFHKGQAIKDWSNKIYILDSEGKQIWRYPFSGRSEIFGSPDAYITSGDITGAIDFAIDKNVYVLKDNGEIQQYYGGEAQPFPIQKEPLDPLEKPTRIFTGNEMNEIFVLEPSKGRVLVFVKDVKSGGIIYNSQYVFDDTVDELRDVYFDKDDRRLYVLTATRLYQVDM